MHARMSALECQALAKRTLALSCGALPALLPLPLGTDFVPQARHSQPMSGLRVRSFVCGVGNRLSCLAPVSPRLAFLRCWLLLARPCDQTVLSDCTGHAPTDCTEHRPLTPACPLDACVLSYPPASLLQRHPSSVQPFVRSPVRPCLDSTDHYVGRAGTGDCPARASRCCPHSMTAF